MTTSGQTLCPPALKPVRVSSTHLTLAIPFVNDVRWLELYLFWELLQFCYPFQSEDDIGLALSETCDTLDWCACKPIAILDCFVFSWSVLHPAACTVNCAMYMYITFGWSHWVRSLVKSSHVTMRMFSKYQMQENAVTDIVLLVTWVFNVFTQVSETWKVAAYKCVVAD